MYLFKKIKQSAPCWVRKIWYQPTISGWLWLLWPLSMVYGLIQATRKKIAKPAYQSRLPVVVVGNITVGGNGKTPAILSLIELFRKNGCRPGIISRGYPVSPNKPLMLSSVSTAKEVGDEPLLIYLKTQVPVAVCKDRALAVQLLEQSGHCDIILSDDGLQNLTFQHDIEIVMVDSEQGFGNCCLLPMGPLRDPMSRLKTVDFVVERVLDQKAAKKDYSDPSHTGFIINFEEPINLTQWQHKTTSATLNAVKQQKWYAITAIANPDSFFQVLSQLGFQFEAHAYPDHYPLSQEDFKDFTDGQIIMTEKDAVKCLNFANERFWCLPLTGHMSSVFEKQLLQKVKDVATRKL